MEHTQKLAFLGSKSTSWVNLETVRERLVTFLLLILIFLSPTFLLGGHTFYSLTVIETLVLLAGLIWSSGRIKIVKSKINLPILCYLISSLLSIINSQYLRGSLEGIIKLTYSILFFLMIGHFFTKRLKLLIQTIIFTTLIVLSFSLFYFFTHLPESLSDRLFYPLGNPNLLAGFLVITIPLMIRILFIVKFRFLLGILLLFSSMTLFFTYSRGGVLGVIGAILFLLFINRQNRYIRYIFIILIPCLLIGVIFLIVYKSGFMTHWVRLEGSFQRLYILEYSWQMFLDHPILGVGLGTYPQVYFDYKQNPTWHLHSHNIFMQHASEVGIIGWISFIWLLISLFKENFSKMLENNSEKAVKEGLLASLIGFLIHGQVDYLLWLPLFQLYFWLILAILTSLRPTGYTYLSPSWFISLIIILFWSLCIFKPYLGYVSFNQGVCLADKGKWEEAKVKFEESVLFDSYHPIYYAHLGTCYTKIHPPDLVDALKSYQTAYQLDRYNPQIYRNLKWLYYQKGNFPISQKTSLETDKKKETLCWKLYRRIPMRELDVYW